MYKLVVEEVQAASRRSYASAHDVPRGVCGGGGPYGVGGMPYGMGFGMPPGIPMPYGMPPGMGGYMGGMGSGMPDGMGGYVPENSADSYGAPSRGGSYDDGGPEELDPGPEGPEEEREEDGAGAPPTRQAWADLVWELAAPGHGANAAGGGGGGGAAPWLALGVVKPLLLGGAAPDPRALLPALLRIACGASYTEGGAAGAGGAADVNVPSEGGPWTRARTAAVPSLARAARLRSAGKALRQLTHLLRPGGAAAEWLAGGCEGTGGGEGAGGGNGGGDAGTAQAGAGVRAAQAGAYWDPEEEAAAALRLAAR